MQDRVADQLEAGDATGWSASYALANRRGLWPGELQAGRLGTHAPPMSELVLLLLQSGQFFHRLYGEGLRYSDKSESVAPHTDKLTALGRRPVIASLSLGATRTFRVTRAPVRDLPGMPRPVPSPPAAGGPTAARSGQAQQWVAPVQSRPLHQRAAARRLRPAPCRRRLPPPAALGRGAAWARRPSRSARTSRCGTTRCSSCGRRRRSSFCMRRAGQPWRAAHVSVSPQPRSAELKLLVPARSAPALAVHTVRPFCQVWGGRTTQPRAGVAQQFRSVCSRRQHSQAQAARLAGVALG